MGLRATLNFRKFISAGNCIEPPFRTMNGNRKGTFGKLEQWSLHIFKLIVSKSEKILNNTDVECGNQQLQ